MEKNARDNSEVRLEAIENKLDQQYAFLRQQFGDIDLAGNKVEGKVSEQIRVLSERVAIQNGRVKKLEERNIFLDGSAKIVGILFTAGIAVLTIVAMWPRK